MHDYATFTYFLLSNLGTSRHDAILRRRQSRRRSTIMLNIKQDQQRRLQEQFLNALSRVSPKNTPDNSPSVSPAITPNRSWVGKHSLAPDDYFINDNNDNSSIKSNSQTSDIVAIPVPRLRQRR